MDKQKTDHHAVIPAVPGYYVIQTVDLIETQGSIEFVKIPIVAWVVNYAATKDYFVSYPFATPVTFEGTTHDEDPIDGLIVMDPDGKVYDPFFGWWETLEEYIYTARAKHEHKRMQASDL